MSPEMTMADAITALIAENALSATSTPPKNGRLLASPRSAALSSPDWTRPARPRSRRGSRLPGSEE